MTRKKSVQTVPVAVDFKARIQQDFRSETEKLYGRLLIQKPNDEAVVSLSSKIGRMVSTLNTLVAMVYPGDQDVLNCLMGLVSAKFPSFQFGEVNTLTPEMVTESALVENPLPTMEKVVESKPIALVHPAPKASATTVNLVDFFREVPSGMKPEEFTDHVKAFYDSSEYNDETKVIVHTAIRRLPHLFIPEEMRLCVASRRDIALAQYFVQRGERILSESKTINQPSFLAVKGAMHAIAGMHDIANNATVKDQLEEKMKKICSTLLEKATGMSDGTHRFITAISHSGVIRPQGEREHSVESKPRPSFPTANEARDQKEGDDHSGKPRRSKKLFKSHPDEGRSHGHDGHGRSLIPAEKFSASNLRPLSPSEVERANGPDITYATTIHIPAQDVVPEEGHPKRGKKIEKKKPVVRPAHIEGYLDKLSAGGKPEADPTFEPPTDWKDDAPDQTVAQSATSESVVGVEPPPATDFGMPKQDVQSQVVNGLDHNPLPIPAPLVIEQPQTP